MRFNQIIMEDANEDGYNIVHNFNEADDFSFHGENPKRLFDVFCSYPLTHDFAAKNVVSLSLSTALACGMLPN